MLPIPTPVGEILAFPDGVKVDSDDVAIGSIAFCIDPMYPYTPLIFLYTRISDTLLSSRGV